MQNNSTNLTGLLALIVPAIFILPLTVLAIEGDITGNSAVDWSDVNAMCLDWLSDNCSAQNYWCDGADIDESNSVDFFDFALLANNWAYPPITQWKRGVIHFHANTPPDDGGLTLDQMVTLYRDTDGCAIACVTGHDIIYDANHLYTTGSFLAINGVEATSGGPHVVGLGMSSPGLFSPGSGLQGHINNIIAAGGLPMVAHPYWSQQYQHYDMHALLAGMTDCNIIEVYNHYCEAITSWRYGNSEPYWDELLSAGKEIYGYAGEDAHGGGNKTCFTFNMIGVPELTVDAVKNALINGRSYFCCTANKFGAGITITSYIVSETTPGSTISITTTVGEGAQTIKFIGNNGTVLKTVSGNSGSYTITGTEKYVRIKVADSAVPTSPGTQPNTLWTQPVFIPAN